MGAFSDVPGVSPALPYRFCTLWDIVNSEYGWRDISLLWSDVSCYIVVCGVESGMDSESKTEAIFFRSGLESIANKNCRFRNLTHHTTKRLLNMQWLLRLKG